jgi:hypothetical protein
MYAEDCINTVHMAIIMNLTCLASLSGCCVTSPYGRNLRDVEVLNRNVKVQFGLKIVNMQRLSKNKMEKHKYVSRCTSLAESESVVCISPLFGGAKVIEHFRQIIYRKPHFVSEITTRP